MHTGRFDAQFCGLSQSDARRVIAEGAGTLHSDALIHGDYCLPSIMLDDWRLSGFIDLDHAGFSDRHIDIFWGIWTLQFNLHTDAYRKRFLDVYGRDRVDGFIDLDHAGFSDRHIDIFWGIWTLQFNLHTDAYRKRFLDVYGRDRVDQARTDQQILGVPVLLLQSHEVAAHDRRTVHAGSNRSANTRRSRSSTPISRGRCA